VREYSGWNAEFEYQVTVVLLHIATSTLQCAKLVPFSKPETFLPHNAFLGQSCAFIGHGLRSSILTELIEFERNGFDDVTSDALLS
jgi:hypothetical protein